MAELDSRPAQKVKPGKPLRAGLISNPLSGGNRKGYKVIREILARRPEVCHCEASTPAAVGFALDEFSRREVAVIAVNGGDGTVHAVLTEFFRRPWPGQAPLFALLRAGTASMIARDVGLSGSRQAALNRFLECVSGDGGRAVVVERPVLKVETSPIQKPLFGMFFGGAGICQGIRFCLERVHTKGVRGQLAAGVTLARLLMSAAHGDKGGLLRPVSGAIALDGGLVARGEFLLILVSTLERLFLGIRPYWGTEIAPLYFTALTARPQHLLKATPTLLRGRKSRFATPEHGYYSHKVREAHFTLGGDFTLDGEFYAADQTQPISLTEGGKASFLRL